MSTTEQTEKEKTIICFDATEYDNFESCKFKWHLFHHLKIVPKTTKSYLEKGSLLHYLLELYYQGKKESYVDQAKMEEIIESGRIKSLEYDLNLEEVGEIIFQFREYCRFYEEENIIPLYVEQPFTVKLHEDEDLIVMLSGQPDLIFRYGHNSTLNVMDHKKISRNSEFSPLRNQFLLYATAMQTDTVIVNKVGFQKTLKPKERFLRQPIIYSPELLDEWKSDAIENAKLMLIHERAEHFPRNRTSCEKWDGCWYQRYCTTKPRAREFLIGTEYIVGEGWDVGLKLEKK